MGMLRKILKYLLNKKYRFKINVRLGLYNRMDDARFLCLCYRKLMDKELSLDAPVTFNEKLQWLKLHDHNPLYIRLVDKYISKRVIAEKIGSEYIIPTIGIWNRFDDIDFSKLPNQFVIKCTHDSGGIVICKNKAAFNIQNARNKINKSLNKNYFWVGREWPYKNIRPRIIIEKYMEDSQTKELRDYKFYCFDGKVRMFMIASNRFSKEQTYFDYFDEKKDRIIGLQWGNPNSPMEVDIPNKIDEMICIAERLSEGIPHVRIDLYLANNQIYFGEMTFYDGSGLESFEPEKWDYTVGSWLALPGKND